MHFTTNRSPILGLIVFLFRLVIAGGIAFSISTLVELQIFHNLIESYSLQNKYNRIETEVGKAGYVTTVENKKQENDSIAVVNNDLSFYLEENTRFNKRRVFRRYPNIATHPAISSLYNKAVRCSNGIASKVNPVQQESDKLTSELKIHEKIEEPDFIFHELNAPFWG